MKKDLQKMLAVIALFLLPFSLFSQEYGQNLFESFENGIPESWSQEAVFGDVQWVKETGGTWPTGVFDGGARVKFTVNSNVTTNYVARLITPELNKVGDVPFSKLVDPILIFAHAQDKWTNDFDVLRVLYRTSADGEWRQLKKYDKYISKWTLDTLSLAVVSGAPYLQFAFEAQDNLGRGVVLDRVEVRSAPNCFIPDKIKADNISNDSAVISWTGAWDVESFSIKVSTAKLTEEQLNDVAFKADAFDGVVSNTRKCIIKNLQADAKYYYYLRSNCELETSAWAVDSFSTLNYLTLPYSEDFNYPFKFGYTTRLANWYYGSSEGTDAPFINTGNEPDPEYGKINYYSTDSTFSLLFYKQQFHLYDDSPSSYLIPANEYAYAVMPQLPDTVDLQKLYLSFTTIRCAVIADNYKIIVGMMENPRDITTFETIDTIIVNDLNVDEEIFVYFKNYKGKGRNIAFLSNFAEPNGFALDNLYLDYATSKFGKVGKFQIAIPSANSITIDFDANYAQYEVVASTIGLTASQLSDATDVIRTTIADKGIVGGLTEGQHYFVYVRATDGTDAGEWSFPRYVYMPGKVTELPFMLGGDMDVTGTSPHPNWSGGNTYIYKVGKDINRTINTPCFPKGATILFNDDKGAAVNTVNASQNGISSAPSKFVYTFHVSGSTAFVPGLYSAFVMPEVTDLDNTRITFYIQNVPDNNAFSSTVVGLLSDANDISTFTPIDTINLNDGEGRNVFYDLGKYKQYGKFFAIYASTDDVEGKANDNRFYFDNVEFISMPPCADPTNFKFTSAPNDPSKVTMTWDANGATSWEVRISEYAYSPEEADGERAEYIYNGSVTTNSLTLEDLKFPKAKYYYSLRSICDESTVGYWTLFESFETECYAVETTPYVETFDAYTTVDPEVFAAPCLKTQIVKDVFSGSSYYFPQVKEVEKGVKVLALGANIRTNRTNGDMRSHSYVAFPLMDKDVTDLQISFDVYCSKFDYSLSVGVMDNPYDSLTFTEVKRVNSLDGSARKYVRYVVSLADYKGKGEYIAIFANKHNAYVTSDMPTEFRIDNVAIEVIHSCARPENIKASNLTAETVTLSWESANKGETCAVAISNSELTMDQLFDPQGVRIDTVNATPAVIAGLTPNTQYFVYLKSVCGDETSSVWSNAISFTTACSALSITEEVVENFDSNRERSLPECFIVGNKTKSSSSYPTCTAAYQHSGSISLNFSTVVSGTDISNGAYAIATQIDIDDICNLRLKFWGSVGQPTYATKNYAHSIIVGVVTDPLDLSSFQAIDTLAFDVEWRPFEVSFAKYEGDYLNRKGKYVIFLSEFALDNVVFIDDISFSVKPACTTLVEIDNVTSNSIDVEVTGTAPFQVVYSEKMLSEEEFTTVKAVEIEKGNSVTIDNLNPNTNYYVYASSSCGSEWSTVEVVRTNCVDKVTFPLSDNFDGNTIYGLGATPDCWLASYRKDNIDYPSVSADVAKSGERSVLVLSTDASEQAYLITPEIDANLSESMVTFYAQPAGRGAVSVVVGIVENINDVVASFVPVDTVMLEQPNWTRHQVFFTGYKGVGKHIAFMSDFVLNQQVQDGFFIDDIFAEVVPACARPFDFNYVDKTDASITVSFSYESAIKGEIIAGPVGFNPEGKEGMFTEFTIGANGESGERRSGLLPGLSAINTANAEAKGLAPKTEYDLYVRVYCNEKEASPWTYAGKYSTVNVYVKEFPYVCDFDTNDADATTWNFAQDNQTDKWYIGTDDAHEVSATNDPNDKALYISYDGGASMKYYSCVQQSGEGSGDDNLKPTDPVLPPVEPERAPVLRAAEELKTESYSWAYRTVYFEPGIYEVSYSWTCTGNMGRGLDYIKVFFVSADATLGAADGSAEIVLGERGYFVEPVNMFMEGILDATPSEVPDRGMSALLLNDNWSDVKVEVMIEEAGLYNMAFAWVNMQGDGATEILRSGAIDDIGIERQSCSAPYNVEKTSLGSYEIDFTWNSLEEDAKYLVKVTSNQVTPFDDLADEAFAFIDTVSTKSVTVRNLQPTTLYRIQVATICGEDNISKWSEALTFETMCAPFKVDTIYSFDGISAIPQCFVASHTKTGNSNYKAPTIKRNNSSYIFDRTGVYSSVAAENGGAIELTHPGGSNTTQGRGYTGGYLAFPMFEGNLNDYTLTFWMRCIYHNVTANGDGKHSMTTSYTGGTYARTISVGTMTDPNDPSTFKLIQKCVYPNASSAFSGKYLEDDPTGENYWVKFSIPLESAEGQFLVFMDEDYGKRNNYVWIDDVEISSKKCQDPIDVKVGNVKMNSAEISFTANASEYTIEIATDNQFTNVVSTVIATSNTHKVTGLSSETQYFARVKAICSESEQSDWSTMVAFKTLFGVVFDEVFTEQIVVPQGWERANGSDGQRLAAVKDVENFVFNYSSDKESNGWRTAEPLFNTGLFSTRHISAPLSKGGAYWLFAPAIDLDDESAKYHLSFNIALTAYGLSESIDETAQGDTYNKFVVAISDNGGVTWSSRNLTEWGTNGDYTLLDLPNTGKNFSVDLSVYAGKPVRIAFYVETNNAQGSSELHLDNVHVNKYTVTEKQESICQSLDFEDENFEINSDLLNVGENSFTNWSLTSVSGATDVLYKLVLNVTPMYETVLPEVNICENGVYTDEQNVFGSLSIAGTYKYKTTTATGCDSVVVLALNVVPTRTTQLFETICPGQSYEWNGVEYNRPGNYTTTFTSVETQCDSIVTLVLSLGDTLRSTEYVYICHGETYDFGGTIISESKTVTNAFKTKDGCDSLVTLVATVLPDYSNIVINDVIKEGEVYNKNGFVGLKTPGTYILETKSKVGDCDSIITLNLMVGNATDYLEVTICHGETYQFGTRTLDQGGVFIEKFAEDSVVMLNLTILEDLRQTIEAYICKGETYQLGDKAYSETGTFTLSLISVDGCDSTITLNLEVLNGDTIYVEKKITQNELPYEFMDLYYGVATEPGTYEETIIIEAENCKDVIFHTLIVDVNDAIDNVNVTDLILVPNPVKANNTLYVEAEFSVEERSDMTIEVFNAVGQRVFVNKPSIYPIEIKGLSDLGVYMVRIITGVGSVYQGKVVVQ